MGYEGLYEVSDYGTVRSLNYHREGKVKYLMNKKHQAGYKRICLCRDGKKKYFSIHRLVWEAFNGPIPEGLQIDHINTVRDDNRLVNLRCVTPKENHANPITAGRKRESHQRLAQDTKWREANRESTRKSRNKTVLQLDKTTGDTIKRWECARDASRELSINFSNISECCNGKRKSTGGFKWRFT